MASTDSIPQPKKNVAYRVIFPIYDADGDLVTGATGLDSEVSKDCGTFTDCTNEATEIATSSGMYYLDLTSTEMNADSVTVIVKTSSLGAKTTPIVLYPEEAGDIRVDVTSWLGTAPATPTVAGVPEVDITHALGSATTATLDSLSSQISSIGSGTGAALNFAVSEDNASTPIKSVTAVGTQTGTYANTLADDGTLHSLASVGNAIDWVYGFSCGAGRSATKFVFRANMGAAGDTVTVQAYNFVTPGWDTRTTVTGTAETLRDVPLLASHTGTSGADTGKVYIRFVYSEGDAGTLEIDEAYIQAQTSGSLIGYADGAIWIKSTGTAAAVPYTNGTADNPCPYANALTLSSALGINRFRILNGETVTLTASAANKSFVGDNWTLALGGQAIDGAYICGAEVSGTGTCTTQPEFDDCHINAGVTVGPSKFEHCGFAGTSGSKVTAGSAGEFILVDCYSEVAGSGTPYFSFPGACGVNIRRWSGGSNITFDNASSTLTMEVATGGGQTIACAGAASIEIRGICRSITLTGIASTTTAQIDAVTGPISLAGADGTVNIYGVCGAVTDSRTGTPLGTRATALNTTNLATPTDVTTAAANVSVDEIQASALADLFNTDSGTTYGAAVAGSVVKEIADNATGGGATTIRPVKNTEFAGFMFPMFDSNTKAPKAGLTVTATRSIDGAAFASCANAVTEIANGVYKITLAAADLNGDKIMLRFVGTDADDQLVEIFTQG